MCKYFHIAYSAAFIFSYFYLAFGSGYMPSLHLARVVSRFEGYRSALDRRRREVFDYILLELAGRREETLVMHPNHTEAALMNALIEMEMRLEALEDRLSEKPD